MNKENFQLDFLGIGVSRAATTWIWECLKKHPEICLPSSKRLPFWGIEKYYSKGISQYRSYFSECSKNQKKGQINDNYYLSSEVALQVKKHFPNVKIIISLRNPTEALYSLYYYRKSFGHKKFKTFEEAIQDKNFIEIGFYYKNIKKWLRLFPKDNFLFLIYNDLKKDSIKFLHSIYNFLEVDSSFVPKIAKERINLTPSSNFFTEFYGKINRFMRKFSVTDNFLRAVKGLGLRQFKQKVFGINKKLKRPKMRKESRKYLQEIFAEDINSLEKLVNRKLDYWFSSLK